MAGLGGALMANLNEYAAPSLFHWILSGEFLVMVILGGMGTLLGPLLGAILFVLLQTILSAYTTYWMLNSWSDSAADRNVFQRRCGPAAQARSRRLSCLG